MKMRSVVTVDVAIVGGGIAGLWLLSRLRQAGWSAILLESHTLGGGQTSQAQGIIHGGMKYALHGMATAEAKALQAAPDQWRSCLEGQGDIPLTTVPLLSKQHYLWAPQRLTAKIAGFLAQMALQSTVRSLARADYPTVFQHAQFKGLVYALDEMVIDIPALIRELVQYSQHALLQIAPLQAQDLWWGENGDLQAMRIRSSQGEREIRAQQVVFTAGRGNAFIVQQLKEVGLAMQCRPLQMVLMKMPEIAPLYAHCLGGGMRPRLTVTTHYRADGQAVWYLGGALAEEGVKRTPSAQISAARHELKALFPWLDFSQAEWATCTATRAEAWQPGAKKPVTASFYTVRNVVVAWPTKLALAPQLATDIVQYLTRLPLLPQSADQQAWQDWPAPALATPIWEEAFCKNAC